MSNTFVVKSAIPERLYVRVYHDFLDSTLINGKEKLIFILLKRYLNFSGESGRVFPTLETLAKQAGMTKKTVAGLIRGLEAKGIVDIEQQGQNKPNIYTLRDLREIWACDDDEEVRRTLELNEEKEMVEKLRRLGYSVEKAEKKEELTSNAEQSEKEEAQKNKKLFISDKHNSTNDDRCQEEQEVDEEYALEELKEMYDYDAMIHDHPTEKEHIDYCVQIIYDTVNSNEKTIRVQKQQRPKNVVKSRLLKLTCFEILYVIEKFLAEKQRIKHPKAYLLTQLYEAKGQMALDMANEVAHDFDINLSKCSRGLTENGEKT